MKAQIPIVCLIVITSCGMINHTTVVGEKKTIPLYTSLSSDAIVIRLDTASLYTCYFARNEWSAEIDKITTDSILKAEYFSVLDSLQRTNGGIIDVNDIPICANDPKCLNPYAVSGKIIHDLMLTGHLCVLRNNGTFVKSLLYKMKIRKGWRIEEFKDSNSRKTVYVFSAKASFF